MMRNFFIKGLTALTVAFAITSCEKNEITDQGVGQGEFILQFDNVSGAPVNSSAKAKNPEFDIDLYPICSEAEPYMVSLYIEGPNMQPAWVDVKMTALADQTEVLKLDEGTYTVSDFIVKDADDNPLYSTPHQGSQAAADFGLTGLPFTFDIVAFTKTHKTVDVLCYVPASSAAFGFKWFQYAKNREYELRFFGNIATKFHEYWHEVGSPYNGQTTYDGYDFPAIFEIDILKNGAIKATYSNASFYGEGNFLAAKYIDNLEDDLEVLEFAINLIMPDGTKEEIHRADITDGTFSEAGNPNGFGGADGIFDFVIGNADSFGNNDINLSLPAWLPVPTTTTWSIPSPLNWWENGYQDVTINDPVLTSLSELPNGIFGGFCLHIGVPFQTNTVYDARVFTGLHPEEMAAALPNIPSADAVRAVQWLMNNMQIFDAYINYNTTSIIPNNEYIANEHMRMAQNVIWKLLGQNGSGADGYDVSNRIGLTLLNIIAEQFAANILANHGDYVPTVGEYALVVLAPLDNASYTYQSFGVRVDP